MKFTSPEPDRLHQLPRRTVVGGLLFASVAACRPPVATPKAPVEPQVVPRRDRQSARLAELTGLDPSIRLDLRYATTNNFTRRRLYAQPRAFLAAPAAEALVRAHKLAQADGCGLTIFDAYRPWRVTKALWDATPRSQRDYVANPKRGSRHNRGCAVDLTLHDLRTGALVEMPTGFDDFSPRAHRDYPAASPPAIANRARLQRYMEAEGFTGLSNEWWHFDFRGWEAFPVLDIAFEDL